MGMGRLLGNQVRLIVNKELHSNVIEQLDLRFYYLIKQASVQKKTQILIKINKIYFLKNQTLDVIN